MENPKLEDLLMQFVRERDTLHPDALATITTTITSPQNVDYGINYLINVKRDVESQFVAKKTRVKDFYAECEEAKRNGDTVAIDIDSMASGSRVRTTLNLPPDEAYAKYCAKEGRWQVKNQRFLALIESAIATLKLSKRKTSVESLTTT